ncbi:hypothetical protein Tco_0541148, partial [Tanacetum coccineum]
GVGLLSGKGPRVIVSADVSILPQSVFVRGGAMGAAFKGTHLPLLLSIENHTSSVRGNNYSVRLTSLLLFYYGQYYNLKCVSLTQEQLDAICSKYFIPEEVHPQLPSSDATMHERSTGNVGMYIRFFDYANYRIPFRPSLFLFLTHFSHSVLSPNVCIWLQGSHLKSGVAFVISIPVDNIECLIRTADPSKVRIVEKRKNELGEKENRKTGGRKVE